MAFEWKYFVWNVNDVYNKIIQCSPKFVMFSEEFVFEFKLAPFMNTSDDMFVINLKTSNATQFKLPALNLAVFVRDTDGGIRFLQKFSVESSRDVVLEELVWKIKRMKFLQEGDSILEAGCASKNVTFVCVFGPACSFLEETMKIDEIPMISRIDMPSTPCTHCSLSSDFSKIWETGSFSDIVLNCGGRSFPAHKAILSGRSSVFADMFQHMSESFDDVLDINDIDATVFADFLQYVYSGKRPALSTDTAPLLYKAGHKYAVESLMKACAAYMVENLNEATISLVYDFHILADFHDDKEFRASVMSFIKKKKIWFLDEGK